MDIHSKIIVCTTLDENGNVVRKDRFENSFENLEAYLYAFQKGDSFVMESTGFYESLYDFIESHGFQVKLANPLKIRLIAESRMKNDDVDFSIGGDNAIICCPSVNSTNGMMGEVRG